MENPLVVFCLSVLLFFSVSLVVVFWASRIVDGTASSDRIVVLDAKHGLAGW